MEMKIVINDSKTGKSFNKTLENDKADQLFGKKINLVAAIQFIDQMNDFKDRIKDKEFVVKQSLYRAMYPGQILGCDVYAADCSDCDATLAFEQGMFHVLGIPLKYGKTVITADPETENIEIINAEVADKYRKRIMQGIGAVLTAKKVMFVESTKAGQTYGSKLLKEKLRKDGDGNCKEF